jgi:hypothetical protein
MGGLRSIARNFGPHFRGQSPAAFRLADTMFNQSTKTTMGAPIILSSPLQTIS